ncbi:MAG: protein TolQ [Deltaproteobacteria bacterium]|nr:protein TolQ [Deltaproteobacteria bacterium]
MPTVIYANLYTFLQSTPNAGAQRHVPTLTELVWQATIPVKLVMASLVLFSIVSWYIIGYKALYLRRAATETEKFLKIFYETRQLNVAADEASKFPRSPVSAMFRAGYEELRKLRAAAEAGEDGGGIENVERALRRATSNEVTQLESMTPFLATVGSTSPFIGLFGTVYGIMHAFLQLSGSQDQSTIDRVGPGIAEALLATAIGLVAAIPAVIGYNFFLRRVRVLTSEMDSFSNDFLNIVRRHILR